MAPSRTIVCRAAGIVVAIAVVSLHPATAEAQTKTWLGGVGANWSSAGNWSGGTVPSGTVGLRWSGTSTGNLTSTNDISGLTVAGMVFTGVPGPVTIGGNSLAITATTTSVSITTGTAAVTINMPLSMLFGTLTLNTSGGGPLTINGNIGQSGTVAGISLAAGSGWGAVTLNGANTFSGAANVNSGTLTIGNLDAIGAAQALGSGTTIRLGYTLVTDQGFIRYTGPATTTNKRIQLGQTGDNLGGGGFLNDGTGAVIWTGSMVTQSTATKNLRPFTLGGSNADDNEWRAPIVNVSGSAPVSLTKAGTGKWILSGTNTYSGTTTVAAGVLGIANNLALQNSPLDTSGAGTITLTVTNPTLGGLVGSTNLSSVITSGYGSVTNLTLNPGADATFTYGGTVSDGAAGMTLTKTGAGTHVLTGANSYTGGTLVGAGILQIGAGGTTGSIVGNATLTSATAALVFNRSDASSFAGVIAGSGTVAKQGTGALTLSGSSTFTRAVDVNEGLVALAWMSASGQPSPLGTAASVNLGSGTSTGGIRYTGTGQSFDRTLNLAGTSGGGLIEANGTGPLVITSVAASGSGSKTLTLGGTSTALNAISANVPDAPGAALAVIKAGAGIWRLTGTSDYSGGFTLKSGTVLAAANGGSSGNPGAFGTGGAPVVGDQAAGASGTAALLAEANAQVAGGVTVAAAGAGSTQTVLVGGINQSGTVTFSNDTDIKIGRDFTLVAATGGVVKFGGTWWNLDTTAAPTANVTIGAPDFAGTVRLMQSGTLATTGSVAVRHGMASIANTNTTLDGAGTLAIDAGATLGGVGTVAAPLGGAGLVAPGNSPGILTAEALDPTGGLDLAFEFTGTAPTYSSGTASVNDVLRLTAASPFLSGTLSGSNVVSLYLPSSAAAGGTFVGGFFTDATAGSFAGFQNAVAGGNFVAYYENSGGGFSYGGLDYSLLADLGKSVQVGTITVPGTTNFQTGGPAVDGQITTFTVVVPEPAALALAGLGVALAAWKLRRPGRPDTRKDKYKPHRAR